MCSRNRYELWFPFYESATRFSTYALWFRFSGYSLQVSHSIRHHTASGETDFGACPRFQLLKSKWISNDNNDQKIDQGNLKSSFVFNLLCKSNNKPIGDFNGILNANRLAMLKMVCRKSIWSSDFEQRSVNECEREDRLVKSDSRSQALSGRSNPKG